MDIQEKSIHWEMACIFIDEGLLDDMYWINVEITNSCVIEVTLLIVTIDVYRIFWFMVKSCMRRSRVL